MRSFHVDSPTKKNQERRLFKQFCGLNPQLKLRLLDQPDPPAIDVLAEFDGRVIAIEIMRYFSSERKKQVESEDKSTLELARCHYQAQNERGVNVRVAWAPYRSRRFADRSRIALAIAKFVAKKVPPVGAWATVEGDALPAPLDEAVNYISLDRLDASSTWQSKLSGWFAPLQAEEVQQLIDRKEQNIEKYKKNADAVWLLISTENSPAAWCELAVAAQSAAYKTKFERVFFVGDVPKRSFTIKTQNL
jgi:hypothetical protein